MRACRSSGSPARCRPAPSAAAPGRSARLAGAQARQDHRRRAGIGRRRHPGIDAEIRDRHHALPVERRGDALDALAAGGEERRARAASGRARAARTGSRAHSRGCGKPALKRARGTQRAFDMGAPQRERPRIALGGRRSRRPWRSPADARGRCARSSRRRPSNELGMRSRRIGTVPARQDDQQDEQADRAPHRRQPQPQAGPGHDEEKTDHGRERGERRPQPLPQNRLARPRQRPGQQRLGQLLLAAAALVARALPQGGQSLSTSDSVGNAEL